MTSSAEWSRSADSSSINRAKSSSPRPAFSLSRRPTLAWRAIARSGMPSLARRGDQVVERGLAHPAGRDVDHPREGEVVLGVGHQVQVGQDVLDLLPLVERRRRRRPGRGSSPRGTLARRCASARSPGRRPRCRRSRIPPRGPGRRSCRRPLRPRRSRAGRSSARPARRSGSRSRAPWACGCG